MSYRWKPSASARREFAQNMQDEQFKSDYYARKQARADKRRAKSQFDYNTAGGEYKPTKEQHDQALNFLNERTDLTPEQCNACNMVLSGYILNENVDHDYIHIVNELIRSNL
jgi:hypothetical protein